MKNYKFVKIKFYYNILNLIKFKYQNQIVHILIFNEFYKNYNKGYMIGASYLD